MSDKNYAELIPFCTTGRSVQIMTMLAEGKSYRAIAEKLKIGKSTVGVELERVRKRIAKQQTFFGDDQTFKLMDWEIPKGRSHLDKETMTWFKTAADPNKVQAMVEQTIEEYKTRLTRVKPVDMTSTFVDSALLNLYVLTDLHLGMMAWGEETGSEDWDLKKGEATAMKWIDLAIERSPAAEIGVFAQLGDFMHWDSWEAVTPASRHALDADTRLQRVIRGALRVRRYIIQALLQKHKKVIVLMADANHDPTGGAWLRESTHELYADEPRIEVVNNADTYYCIEHGKCSLFFHHGHKRQGNNAAPVFAAKFREIFGRTEFSHAHIGHLHSDEVVESPLMKVERHRTLAPADAYAAKGGWLSGRDSKVITYHAKYGELTRQVVSINMIKDMMKDDLK